MGSSVRLHVVFGLWITSWRKKGTTNTNPRKFVFLGDDLLMNLRCHLCCQLLQMVLVGVKTAGY